MSHISLDKKYWNTQERSPRCSWMMRGHEDKITLPISSLKTLSTDLLTVISSEKLFLPKMIRALAIVESYRRMFFTTPDSPWKIFSIYLPNPVEDERPQKKFRASMGLQDTLEKIPVLSLDEEIIDLAATDTHLFALTLSQGRSKDSGLWQLIRIEVDTEKGFLLGHKLLKCTIEMPPEILINQKIRLSVVRLYTNTFLFYLSGLSGGRIYWGKFVPSNNTVIDKNVLSIENEDTGGIINVSSKLNINNKYQGTVTLYACNNINGKIYKIFHDYNSENPSRFRVDEILREKLLMMEPSDISLLHIKYSNMQLEIEPENLIQDLILIASSNSQKIFTYNENSQYKLLPLIGGGYKSLDTNLMVPDILFYDIGPIDFILTLYDSCIIFGCKDKVGWGAILLPQMSKMLKGRYAIENMKISKNLDSYWS